MDPQHVAWAATVPIGSWNFWQFVLCPDAAEGGGSFRQASSRETERWSGKVDLEAAEERSRVEAGRRARRQLRQYCAANRLNRLGTLTYGGAGCHDPAQVRADVAAFIRVVRGSVGRRFPYVWVPEWHSGGHGLHLHFAVGRYIQRGVIEEAWGRGFVSIKLLGDLPVGSGSLAESRLAARYLGKYVAKSFGEASAQGAGRVPAGLHRYEVAQGFQPSRLRLVGRTDLEVLAEADEVMGRPSAKRWYSNETKGWMGPPAMWASWDR
jgi:hypothetical protein